MVMALVAALIDISAWYLLRDEAQLRLDIAAMSAAQFLPQGAAAERVAIALLTPEHATNASFQLQNLTTLQQETGPDGLALSLTFRYMPPLLSSLLGRGTSLSPFQIGLSTAAEIVPVDFMLLLADGESLRPGKITTSDGTIALESAWGESFRWPASPAFNCLRPPTLDPAQLPFSWWSRWGDPNFQRWLTQACENPVLTPVKQAALAAVREISMFRAHRLAVFLTPGQSETGVSLVRPLMGLGDPFLAPRSGAPESLWQNTIAGDLTISDDGCALFDRFTYHPPNEPIDSAPNDCPIYESPIVCGQIYRPFNVVGDCHKRTALTLGHVLRWHAITISDGGTARIPRADIALRRAIHEAATPPAGALTATINARRQNHSSRPRTVLVLVTDKLPVISAMGDIILELAHRRISLSVVVFTHFGLATSDAEQLYDRFLELNAMLTTVGNRSLRVAFAESPKQLESTLLQEIITQGRRHALKR